MITEDNKPHENVVSTNEQSEELTDLKVKDEKESNISRTHPSRDDYDNDSLNEKSFEVIGPVSSSMSNMDSKVDETNLDGSTTSNEYKQPTTDKHGNTSEQKLKHSSKLFARLQSSSDETDGSNITSSIANAFSSLSSFTSNFTLNSHTDSSISASALTIETASTSSRFSRITESKEESFKRKAALERKNLICLTKLIVKDLISSSMIISRTIDDSSNAIHLNNYFTLLDRVLKHGLKQNMLSNKSMSLWNALDSLPKYLKESTLMSESVRSLANTKTPDGKIKAWIRLAMMQKKLPEYFTELLAHKNELLKDIYHDYAFMLNDEASVFAGLIIGVNVIDCNFFVKDANFDAIDEIINLSPYLRTSNGYDDNDQSISSRTETEIEGSTNLTAILDQKNYLEEWNKRLEATMSDLQTKIKKLEEQNSKLEMEAKVSEARILKLSKSKYSGEAPDKQVPTSISEAIKSFIGNSVQTNSKPATDVLVTQASISQEFISRVTSDVVDNNSPEKVVSEENETFESRENKLNIQNEKHAVSLDQKRELELAKHQLKEQENELISMKERISILEASYRSALERIKVLERDLDIQTSINADKETTIKMYEKDIREKQNQVESLRSSLQDSRKIQSDLSEKFNETNSKLKERIKSVTSLQSNLDKWRIENKALATRLQDKQTALKTVTLDLEKALNSVEELKRYNEKINDELKKERESGHSSSVTLETQNSEICELREKVSKLEHEMNNLGLFRDQTEELKKRCQDYEQSLEEVGLQLKESRLEVENLKENSAVFLDSQWMDSKQVKSCTLCLQTFSVTRRKHHCRLCGNVFCQNCSDNKMELASSAKPVRVCDTCHGFLLAKFVKSST